MESLARPSGISLDDVRMEFSRGSRHVQALDGVTFTVPDGTFGALIGPSGCGKSTVLRLVAGLLEPRSGRVLIGADAPAKLVAEHRLGVAFQNDALLPWASARNNVALPYRIAGLPVDERRVDELLERVGVAEFARARPSELSGGMRQRVALARSLVLDPRVLLLDEPFGALDAVTRRQLNLELQRVWAQHAMTALLVTHSVEEAVFLADRVFVMSQRPGRVLRTQTIPFPRPRARTLLADADFHAIVDDLTAALDAEFIE